MQTTLPCMRITQQAPRVTLTMSWGEAEPIGEYRLYVKRVGDADDFAYYPAIEVKGGESTFQLDNLVFAKGVGRFEATLVISGVTYARVQLDYRATNTLVSVENPNV